MVGRNNGLTVIHEATEDGRGRPSWLAIFCGVLLGVVCTELYERVLVPHARSTMSMEDLVSEEFGAKAVRRSWMNAEWAYADSRVLAYVLQEMSEAPSVHTLFVPTLVYRGCVPGHGASAGVSADQIDLVWLTLAGIVGRAAALPRDYVSRDEEQYYRLGLVGALASSEMPVEEAARLLCSLDVPPAFATREFVGFDERSCSMEGPWGVFWARIDGIGAAMLEIAQEEPGSSSVES